MTAFADVATAREALTRGALDYLVKPFDNDELVSLVRRALERRKATRATSAEAPKTFAGMTGRSEEMQRLFSTIERVARGESAVLVVGESGTGKELVARAIHAFGPRHAAPFVDVNCAAIPATLIESELFGHEKGAFTGALAARKGRIELAAKGTLFLDEIGEMPLELQPKLLRFLQERRFYRVGGNSQVPLDVRVLAATNRDIDAEVRAKRFREDLYFRLAVVRVDVPPLRDRPEDVRPLVAHILRLKGRPPERIDEAALRVLESYSWPGNVRELENVIEQALLESEEGAIERRHLPPRVTDAVTRENPPIASGARAGAGAPKNLDLDTNERQLIEEALRRTDGNKSKAADLLGITRRRLYSRMSVLGIDPGTDRIDREV
jgi:DNA-binding NtrC family response regulator